MKKPKRTTITSPDAPPIMAGATYSPAIRIDQPRSLVFVSGQTSRSPRSGKLVFEGDIRKQTRRALENLGALLEAAGAGFNDIVKMTVFLVDIKDNFGPMHEVRSKFLKTPYPASSTVEVTALAAPGMLIEIEAVAAI